jgi:ERCC4-type nuclease
VYSYASKSKERRMHRHLKLLREALKQNQKLIVSDPSVSTPPTLKPSFGIATKRPMDKSGTIGRKPTGIVSHGTIAGDEKVQLEPPKKKGQVKLTDYTTSRNSSDCTGTTGTTNAKNCDCSGSGSNSQNPAIIVDNREFMSEVVRELYRQGAKVNREQLKVGDYVISDRICIERKEATDFLDSLVGGRLFQQLKYLKNNYVCPIFILEGYGILTRRQIDKNAVFGALASIVADFNIPVITTKDCKETAEVIFSIAKREHKVKREVGLRNIKNSMGLHERQQFIIEGLPHISGVLAKRLLTHFGSVESVMNANASELLKVAGIGKKTAEDIRRVIEAQYNNGNE